ncbi:uncharacterized protein LOC112566949 [Pomacea canaliculata]|uniref:uncharacterized protein LOC112566949 n=1 Tax=Pomacea canaliculata TaxID=400727 RepID=UPI000D737071|nr:uncharacterized protein LOC112566949 [Pomacea canaliculata]
MDRCADRTATVCVVIVRYVGWRSPLCVAFVDFGRALGSVGTDIVLGLGVHCVIPPVLMGVIWGLCGVSSCQVVHSGGLAGPFVVMTGVGHGCMLFPAVFPMVMGWIVRGTTQDNTGIQYNFSKQLEDLDFADDISHISHLQQHAQTKLSKLAEEAEGIA